LNATDVLENIAGGSGNDTLTGNSLANILVGNAGDDTLNGGGGGDILIGGFGLDTLNGGEDEDILIAGFTTSDSLFSDLNVLLSEWVSVNSYATRISNLRAGVGAPAVSLLATVNVLNDAGEVDSLVGGNGTDWYFRALDDVVTDLVTDEVLDIL
jgi:Ca2+-binding RTX toxin-like protein